MENKRKEIFDFGDKITFNYKAKIENENSVIKKENIILFLGENTFLPNFDLNFLFLPFNKKVKFNYIFSDNYLDVKLAGKNAEFDIEIIDHQKNTEKHKFIEKKFKKFLSFYDNFRKKNHKKSNYEKEINEKNELILNLEKINFELKLENKKNLNEFNEKAKTFTKKAQEELEKHKKEQKLFLENEFEEKQKYNFQKLFEDIISPLNNFKLAIQSGFNQDDLALKSYVQGFSMLLNQTYSILENYGLTIIEPKEGEYYNPEFHHAVELVEDSDKNTIIQIKAVGYKFHDRVIKPASVTIGK